MKLQSSCIVETQVLSVIPTRFPEITASGRMEIGYCHRLITSYLMLILLESLLDRCLRLSGIHKLRVRSPLPTLSIFIEPPFQGLNVWTLSSLHQESLHVNQIFILLSDIFTLQDGILFFDFIFVWSLTALHSTFSLCL